MALGKLQKDRTNDDRADRVQTRVDRRHGSGQQGCENEPRHAPGQLRRQEVRKKFFGDTPAEDHFARQRRLIGPPHRQLLDEYPPRIGIDQLRGVGEGFLAVGLEDAAGGDQ